jgi:hypothetical protein
MEDFVPFLLAKKLEEKGFQIEFKYALGYYDTRGQFMTAADHWFLEYWTIAPTISQALKWLREEKKIHIIVEIADSGWYYTIYPNIRWEDGKLKSDKYFMSFKHKQSFELATLAGIEYCLDNLI